jgi:hypothetical protein
LLVYGCILKIVLTFAEVMNISEGTVVAAPKVGRPRKAVVIAPGGTCRIYLKNLVILAEC